MIALTVATMIDSPDESPATYAQEVVCHKPPDEGTGDPSRIATMIPRRQVKRPQSKCS